MSFQVGIGSLGGTVFFKVGLCTPLQTMGYYHVITSMDICKPYLFFEKKNIENWVNWKQPKEWRHFDPNLIFPESIHLR